jgi:hypothetical protein
MWTRAPSTPWCAAVNEAQADVSQRTAAFIATDEAMQPYVSSCRAGPGGAGGQPRWRRSTSRWRRWRTAAGALDMLSELMGSLSIDDATQRTQVVDRISPSMRA